MCLAWPGLFPVINPWRMAAGYPSLFLILPFHSSSSWLTHSTCKPHLFYRDTTKDTTKDGENENEKRRDLSVPSVLFDTSSWGRFSLSLSPLCYPSLSSSILLPKTKNPLISPHLSPCFVKSQSCCGSKWVTDSVSVSWVNSSSCKCHWWQKSAQKQQSLLYIPSTCMSSHLTLF